MVYQLGDYEAIHEKPIWRDRANFIIAAYLGEKDGHGEWEQLWAQQLDDQRFLLCCIPFFAFDLALGDVIETNDNYTVQRVVSPSGQYTFRVWFGDLHCAEIRDEVVRYMDLLGVLMEWSSENLLALSARDADQAKELADYLHFQQNTNCLLYETGRTE